MLTRVDGLSKTLVDGCTSWDTVVTGEDEDDDEDEAYEEDDEEWEDEEAWDGEDSVDKGPDCEVIQAFKITQVCSCALLLQR